MNICLVSQEYPPDTARGGIGTQTWNKARTLAGLGHTVHVLSCAARPGPDLQTRDESGVTVHRLQPPGSAFPVYKPATYWMGYSWAVFEGLHHLIRTLQFDVVDFAEYGAEGFCYQLDRAPWNWIPVVVQLHGPLAMFTERIGWPDRESEHHRVGTFMEAFSIREADSLMACSANIADYTAEFYRIPRDSIDVVHCGVDAAAFQPGEKGEQPKEPPTVLFVGNIVANKGVHTVLEAVLRLRNSFPSIRLQILGKMDKGLAQDLQSRAQSAGAEANVEFRGFIDRADLPAFYRQAHVFASPAAHEVGVANVYIEAMACGCPVVAATTGAAGEAVSPMEAGLLVPPNDVEATSNALARILGDAALRRRMGEAGRRRVEEYFAMDRYIARVLATYEKAISRSRERLDRLKASTDR